MKSFEWSEPQSTGEALFQINSDRLLKAGGVDLLDLMKKGITAPQRLISLRRVPHLDTIQEDSTHGLRLGPMTTLAHIAQNKAVKEHYPALAEAAGNSATPQIRNMATVAGNILQRPRCWYFRSSSFHCRKKGGTECFALQGENKYHAIFENDLCAMVHPSSLSCALMALKGIVEITDSKGKRDVSLDDFFTLPKQGVLRENILSNDSSKSIKNDSSKSAIISQIKIPRLPPGTSSFYLRQGEKQSFDWPLAEVAVVLRMKGGRCSEASVVLGAVAPVPLRATTVEAYLNGKAITEEVAEKAGALAVEGAAPLLKTSTS